MTECQDCADECTRRTRCGRCNLLVCSWCHHHVHAWRRGPFAAAGSGILGSNPPDCKIL